MLLVLVLLHRSHPRPMTTYEIGLAVRDDHRPPRPLSVLVKALAKDRCVAKADRVGKRARAWTVTDRGVDSLRHRAEEARRAGDWLDANGNHSDDERAVASALLRQGPQHASQLAASCGLMHSPVRTALKRLRIRSMARQVDDRDPRFALTDQGVATVEAWAAGSDGR